jgi:hypothetical protein
MPTEALATLPMAATIVLPGLLVIIVIILIVWFLFFR